MNQDNPEHKSKSSYDIKLESLKEYRNDYIRIQTLLDSSTISLEEIETSMKNLLEIIVSIGLNKKKSAYILKLFLHQYQQLSDLQVQLSRSKQSPHPASKPVDLYNELDNYLLHGSPLLEDTKQVILSNSGISQLANFESRYHQQKRIAHVTQRRKRKKTLPEYSTQEMKIIQSLLV